MKKSTLEITEIENGKPVSEIKKGYTSTAKTSDGVEIELFVYKEDNKLWSVVETVSKTFVHLDPTRNNAILGATITVKSTSYDDLIKGNFK